ncbi:origin recognition complex subunit 3 [Chelonus insularis]|uniref:origin recognition complex subunit 3 n=1 Tax=Chelonus insularis TaxID=460826 RepID=UPI001588B311|nr:origin recognition complex subunit 3 [Chelonus insularis]
MDNVSVSKGIFAYKGKYRLNQKPKKIDTNPLINTPWYRAYKDAWSIIENSAKNIDVNMSKQILSDVKKYVENARDSNQDEFSGEIATAILLTGVNLPDHGEFFRKLSAALSLITKQIAVIPSRDSGNLKTLMEESIYQLINSSDDVCEVKKSQCNFRQLKLWYSENCKPNTPLVIIIPDFESFNPNVLRDFISVLSSYSRVIKFVLVFGVATTLHAVHRSLSYDVTSKLRVQVFHTQKQVKSLSDVLEGTVLSGKSPFMLTGKAFQLLTDIFLFYDFSVNGFIQGYKLCMFQHFFENNLTSLCCDRSKIKERLKELSAEDFKELSELPSVIKYLEKSKQNIDSNISEKAMSFYSDILHQFHDYIGSFFVILKCLHSLTTSLPGAPLGKQLREVYANAVICDLPETPEYKKSMQLLNFMSKEELIIKLQTIISIIRQSENVSLKDLLASLGDHLNIIENASTGKFEASTNKVFTPHVELDRLQFQNKLFQNSQQQSRSPFKQAQLDLINYLNDKVFPVFLKNPNRLPASEIFCFSDAYAGKQHLRGSHRAAIHTGLNNPKIYLNCNCCNLENDQTIQPTLPDLSIVYKLHLESRKLINMYDWLQAFLMVVDPNNESEQTEVDPEIQARFTRAVAELQRLGFIKSSRKKTDHVKRLT